MVAYPEENDCCEQQVDDKIWGLLCNKSTDPNNPGVGIFEDFTKKLFGCINQHPDTPLVNILFTYRVVYQDWWYDTRANQWKLHPPKKKTLVTAEQARDLLEASKNCLNQLQSPNNPTGVTNPDDLWGPHPENPEKYSPCQFMNKNLTAQLPACAEFDKIQSAIKSTILNNVRSAFKYGCSKRPSPSDPVPGKPNPKISTEYSCRVHDTRGGINGRNYFYIPISRFNEYQAQTNDLDPGVIQ